MGAEIIQEGAGNRGFTDAALVGADEDDSRFGHWHLLQIEDGPICHYLTTQ